MTGATLPPPDRERVERVLSRFRDGVVGAMRAALDRPGVRHIGLMRYHLGWQDAEGRKTPPSGGKMIRPALCLLSCEAVGGDAARAMPAAAALELLHNFTLIHDDIEDSSDTRRGRETLWRVAGLPQALNVGDGMFVLAQRTLLGMADAGVPADRVIDAARTLDDACVALCEGQHADIEFEQRAEVSLAEYEAMIAGKTAALLGASMAIGAIAGGADAATVEAMGECGRLLGLAFQVQDDVLGIWGESAVTGKPVADDIRSRKKSFPGRLRVRPSRRREARRVAVDLRDAAGRRRHRRRAGAARRRGRPSGERRDCRTLGRRRDRRDRDARARCGAAARHRSARVVRGAPVGVNARAGGEHDEQEDRS